MNVQKICFLGGDELGMMLSVVIAAKCPEVRVTFVDPDSKSILKWNTNIMLESGKEVELFDLLKKVINKNLFFTSNESNPIREAEILFVVSNPEVKDRGEGKGLVLNLSSVTQVGRLIVDHSETDKIVVECSPVPLKTTECLNDFLQYNAKMHISLHVVSNPIFYDKKLGLKSVLFPDRVLVGHDKSVKGSAAEKVLLSVYGHWINPTRIIVKKTWSVELAQIISYALIVQKIAGLCAIKAICNKVGYSFKTFSSQLQKDVKIGRLPELKLNIGKFCVAIKNIIHFCQESNLTKTKNYWMEVLRFLAFEEIYNLELMVKEIGTSDLRVTLFGFLEEHTLLPDISFKICNFFIKYNISLRIYDPKASLSLVRNVLKPTILESANSGKAVEVNVFDDPFTAVHDSQLVVIHSYREAWLAIDFKKVFDEMKKPAYLFDHFHLLEEKEISSIGFQIYEFFPEL